MTIRTAAVTAFCWLWTVAVPGAAQQVDRATGLEVSRPELEQLLRRLDQASAGGDSSEEARGRARNQATAVRTRLAQGDFHGGDRVVLRVESGEAPAGPPRPPAGPPAA